MNLSHKLTFSLILMLLLATFVGIPAIAEVTVNAYYITTTGNALAEDRVPSKIAWTFVYSEDPEPVPDFSHFTLTDGTIVPADTDSEPDVLAASFKLTVGSAEVVHTASIERTGKNVTLTITRPLSDVDGGNVATDIAAADLAGLTLKGYATTLLTGVADRSTDATAAATPLVLSSGYLAGNTYRVYVRAAANGTDAEARPQFSNAVSGTLSTQIAPSSNYAVISATDGDSANSNVVMPDLEDFFNVRGGTIDLVVPGGVALDVEEFDVVINEIMWGADNSKVGQTGEDAQQWIEIYNRRTTPVPAPEFVFTDDTFPPPAKGEVVKPVSGDVVNVLVDRISNIASRQNIWTIKGSSGKAIRNGAGTAIIGADPAFVSVYRSKQDGDGTIAANWTASTRPYLPGFLGTPAEENVRPGLPVVRRDPTPYTPPKDRVIINEVFNHANIDGGLDWLELRNVSTVEQDMKDWRLTYTHFASTGTGDDREFTERNETVLITFPEKIKIPPGELLLIVGKDPNETDLVVGQNIMKKAGEQAFGAGPHKYWITDKLKIPSITEGFLMLRSPFDEEDLGKYLKGRKHLHDVVGASRVPYNTIVSEPSVKEPGVDDTYWKTDAWPINGHTDTVKNDKGETVPGNYRKFDVKDADNSNASLNPMYDLRTGKVWARNGTKHGWRKDGGKHVEYMGGLGYDRKVRGMGTPGYHNDLRGKTEDITDGALIISELMLTTDGGRYPQWIELQNTSRTRGIDLTYDSVDEDDDLDPDDLDPDGSRKDAGWRMIIENYNSGSWATKNRKLVATINLKDLGNIKYIPPNQTVLIVSRTGRHSTGDGNFPDHRVASVWGTRNVRGTSGLDMKSSKDPILNAEGGFYIKIVDGEGNVSDEVGNLDGKEADPRRNRAIDEPYSWTWPNDLTEDGARTSLVRLKDNGVQGDQGGSEGTAGTARKGVPDRTIDGDMTGMVIPLGTESNRRGAGKYNKNDVLHSMYSDHAKAAWVHTVDTGLSGVGNVWYGSSDDVGTPLHTFGTPLPVTLSFFRPTLEDDKVVIQWTTESELDNAGFNILRSDSRDGEFTQVNEQMIQGNGTTGERSTYKWIDTTAKPNAVYYYQIEDVSFAGEHNTLATTKLKGLISAKGKLTTRWGDLKNLR